MGTEHKTAGEYSDLKATLELRNKLWKVADEVAKLGSDALATQILEVAVYFADSAQKQHEYGLHFPPLGFKPAPTALSKITDGWKQALRIMRKQQTALEWLTRQLETLDVPQDKYLAQEYNELVEKPMRTAEHYLKCMPDLSAPKESSVGPSACACLGPQPGHTLCPCKERAAQVQPTRKDAE